VYASALLASAAAALIPHFHSGALFSIGSLEIQSFGAIVALGVLIGAALLRRYAEWHGISDDHIRNLLGWVTICGFIGAHEFDMIAYNWAELSNTTVHQPASWWFLPNGLWPTNWPLPFRLWEGISSYGGFLGGAGGFFFYVWWKRLPIPLFADVTIIGLMPAFSIGRIGCTVVSDHIGSAVDPNAWYSFLAEWYPRAVEAVDKDTGRPVKVFFNEAIRKLSGEPPNIDGPPILAWNLGLIELLYLIPVNAFLLWLAFTPKRHGSTARKFNAGMIAVLAGIFYAPVRFFLDFLRPEETDPRYLGLTFAQYASILALGAAVYAATRVFRNGAVAETKTATSGEMQRQLKMLLKSEGEEEAKSKSEKKSAEDKKPDDDKKPDADEQADADDKSEADDEAAPEKPPSKSAAKRSNKKKR
jgi:phosphatidylglycerol:prolipoprotein diacylglycerol transferase